MPTQVAMHEGFRVADGKGRVALGARYAGKRFALREEADGTAVLTPVLVIPEHDQPLSATGLSEKLAGVEALRDDWDGHGSPAPRREAIVRSREALALLHASALAGGRPWRDPHISANERGQITMEWWRGGRSLTLMVRDAERIDYLKAWGPDIGSQMEDGELETLAQYGELERWLASEERV